MIKPKIERQSWGRVPKNLPRLDLIAVQKYSYQWFLTEGIAEILAEISPIEDFTGKNWQIYFDLSPGSDTNSQITELNLLLSNKISTGPEGYPRKKLRYIDLRPKDRAIICDNSTCGG